MIVVNPACGCCESEQETTRDGLCPSCRRAVRVEMIPAGSVEAVRVAARLHPEAYRTAMPNQFDAFNLAGLDLNAPDLSESWPW